MNTDKNGRFLAGNLRVLESRKDAAYHWIKRHQGGYENLKNRIGTNRRGLMDWCTSSGKGLFDELSPEKVYQNWIPPDEEQIGATIIIGANLGYGVNHVLSHTSNSHRVWVLEPNPEILIACLGQTDYRPFLESGRLLFIPPDVSKFRQVIWQLDVEYIFGKIYIFADLPSYQLGPEYASWVECCKNIMDCFGADLNTMRIKQDIMVRNELANYSRAMKDGNLLTLRQQGRGLHAVVYASGPSMSQFAPLLAGSPGNALHVCGLQVLPTMYRFGIKPHFCMAIDYTNTMKTVCDGLDRTWAKDIPLIYSCKVDPETIKAYPGPTLPIWTVGGLGTFLPREKELVLNGGGSVSVALTRFLVWCGVREILLVGCDFSWKGDKTHVVGHPNEDHTFHYNSNCHVAMNNKWDEIIYSDKAYITALRDFENDLGGGVTKVLNLYGGGMRIKGAQEVSWEEVLERRLLSSGGNLLHFLNYIRKVHTPRCWPCFEARSGQWINSICAVMKKLLKISKKVQIDQQEIRMFLFQIVFFVKQDPLYRPYLFNEILDMVHLARCIKPISAYELKVCKKILKRIIKKVTEVDNYIVYGKKMAA